MDFPLTYPGGERVRANLASSVRTKPTFVTSSFFDSYAGSFSSIRKINSWFSLGGSSSEGGCGSVFSVSKGRLQSVQTVDWDTHFQAGKATDLFDPRTNALLIRSAHYIPCDW